MSEKKNNTKENKEIVYVYNREMTYYEAKERMRKRSAEGFKDIVQRIKKILF